MKAFRLLIFPAIFIILFLYMGWANYDVLNNPYSASHIYVQNFKEGRFSHGIERNYNNGISFADLEPGDIIVGGYPECSYGRFSHAAIYLGDNLVMESYGDLGVTTQPLSHFWDYSEIALLRVEANPELKNKVIEYVGGFTGGLFYPVAFKPGERIWNCTKIIWKAYYEQGIDLEGREDLWTTPDDFYNSSYTRVIREKSQL